MRGLRVAGVVCLVAGGLLLAYAAMEGNVRVGLFLIVPFVYGTGLAPFAGMVLGMAGLVMLMLSAFQGFAAAWPTTHRRSGGVVLLGPIPIVWGDARMRPWMVAVGAALLLLWLLLILR